MLTHSLAHSLTHSLIPQMSTAPQSCLVMAVKANFDECQSLVKDVLNDTALQKTLRQK